MNTFLTYFLNLFRTTEQGSVVSYPDPSPPSDLGSPLSQAEIDFVKKLKKEMEERFTSPT